MAGRLGGLPLALKIAGSYLAQSASIPAAFADPGPDHPSTKLTNEWVEYRERRRANDSDTGS